MSYGHGNQQRLRYIVDRLREYVVGNIIAHKKPLGRAYRTTPSAFSPALQSVKTSKLDQRIIYWFRIECLM